jgi:glycosyltransferase involved in cell wall biosynthesis/peptidoglycan/xylan/chitin deacetylase (PgdA/CDA1 family)
VNKSPRSESGNGEPARSDSRLVSVITIFRNAEKFLQEAIESVFAQTHEHWELLLVDDASNDNSTGVARRFAEQFSDKVKYLEHEGHANRGMSASRNLGIRHARGEYVAFLDGDDVWLPHKLREQVAIMRAQPKAAMVYGRTLIWHSWTGGTRDRRRDRFYTLGVQPDQLIEPPRLLIQLIENRAQTPTTCNVMVRRCVFEQIGFFEESFRGVHEDQAFYTKVHLRAPSFVANAYWAKYRQHPDSSSAVAKQKGLRTAARLRYLSWVEKYLVTQGIKDPRVWKTLKAELWRYRHPLLASIPKRRRYVVSSVKKRIKDVARKTPPPLRRRLRTAWEKTRPQARCALSLMYHRVANTSSDPYQLCVAPRHFEEHLEVVRKNAQVLPLTELADHLRRGRWPRRGVVFTFDDGYVDNLRTAKPLLERYDMPATVFVTSGALGIEHEFWWDEIERLLLRPGTLPRSLTLEVNGIARTWDLAAGSHYCETEAANRSWSLNEPAASLAPRQRFVQTIYRFVLPLRADEKRSVLDQLEAWAPTSDAALSDHRTLSPDDLAELARGSLIEIGAHTVTHPMLPALSISEQYVEMHRSRLQLEQLLGRPVTSFAYPHGEYSPDTLVAVREAGFLRACTTRHRAVFRGANCFEIPRVKVEDCDGDQFARRLDGWFGDV